MVTVAIPSFTDRPFGCPPDDAAFGYDRIGRRRRKPPEFTKDHLDQIKNYYERIPAALFDLSELAALLGKSRQNIARMARKMGLTRRGRPPNEAKLAKLRKPKWQDKPHPRGMTGKKHTAAALAVMSKASKLTWATQKTFGGPHVSEANRRAKSERMAAWQATRPAHLNYTNRRGGHRADLGGQYFRSSWEANYARYLNLLISLGILEHWEYEPETFWFEGIRRGATSYKPDFRLKFKGDDRVEYHEIKGWIVPKDRVKWARMAKYHPHVKLIIIKPKEYYNVQKKWASVIATWESARRARITLRSLHG